MLQDYYDKLINVLKVQGDNLFSHFVSNKIVTLTDYDDSSETFHSRTVKVKWLLQKVSGHLAAGYSMSFHKMLLIMQEHGDVICEALSSDIETSLFELKRTPIPGMYNIFVIARGGLYSLSTLLCLTTHSYIPAFNFSL